MSRAVPAQGPQISVEGQISTRKYTDKDGVEKYATDIRVDQMQMLTNSKTTPYSGFDTRTRHALPADLSVFALELLDGRFVVI